MRMAVDCCVESGVRGGVTPWDLGFSRTTRRAVFGEEVDVRRMDFDRAVPHMYASARPEHTEAETAYGLGALLLAMVTCAHPWAHLLEVGADVDPEVIGVRIEYQTAFEGRRLREAVPADADAPQPEVAALIRACLRDDAAARPTLRGIRRALKRLTVLRAVGA
jgi:hypothetical protein